MACPEAFGHHTCLLPSRWGFATPACLLAGRKHCRSRAGGRDHHMSSLLLLMHWHPAWAVMLLGLHASTGMIQHSTLTGAIAEVACLHAERRRHCHPGGAAQGGNGAGPEEAAHQHLWLPHHLPVSWHVKSLQPIAEKAACFALLFVTQSLSVICRLTGHQWGEFGQRSSATTGIRALCPGWRFATCRADS